MRRAQRHTVETSVGHVPVLATDALGGSQRDAEGDPRVLLPWVAVVPSIFGLTSGLRVQLAELGDHARVLALDPFHHDGGGPWPYDDLSGAVGRLGRCDLAGFEAELLAVLEVLAGTSGRTPVIGLGIGFGGPFVVRAAGRGLLAGVVTWHGSRLETQLDAVRALAQRAVPARFHFGGADHFVPPSTVSAVRDALGSLATESVVVHPGADHGFSHRGGPAYQAVAERAGMNAVLDLVRSCTPR